jgi:CBS domain-containing protein
MQVQEIMTRHLLKVRIGTTVAETANLLIKNHISGAPVVDAEERVVGFLSEKDIFRAMYPNAKSAAFDQKFWADFVRQDRQPADVRRLRVEDLMNRDIITVKPTDPVLEVGAVMLSKGIERILVMDRGRLAGLVARRDVFHAILRHDLGLT